MILRMKNLSSKYEQKINSNSEIENNTNDRNSREDENHTLDNESMN